jgi:hypothetical protein
MAHINQFEYCQKIKARFPQYFEDCKVLDVGSLDINGNNRYFFKDCKYIGIDLGEGKNVDIICPVHKYNPGFQFDIIISTEMLEHDYNWKKSLKRMFKLLKKCGLLLITAATTGRKEHGTYANQNKSSPFTNDYYRNITTEMLAEALDFDKFLKYEIDIVGTDIYFWGIKDED